MLLLVLVLLIQAAQRGASVIGGMARPDSEWDGPSTPSHCAKGRHWWFTVNWNVHVGCIVSLLHCVCVCMYMHMRALWYSTITAVLHLT